ncbi:MAG: PorP/SprF family type IX secretion system membrane protein [Chitinophagales bacterium]|nr:PorP/SprF family type IX secretion system membrane protein [Chitinophagales bacterium]
MKLNSTFKQLVAAVVLLVASYAALAQNEPVIAHYMYHTHVFNPAVSGSSRDIYLAAVARQQWVGYKEAPSTQVLNAYGYIAKARGGVGFVFTNDMLGKQRFTNVRVSYAYSQRLNDRSRLSIGLAVGMTNSFVKGSELIYQQGGDQSGIFDNQSKFKAYLSAGLEFTGYGLTAGFAVTNLDQSLNRSTPFRVPRHYFGYVKYDWDINEKARLTPAVFVRSIDFTAQAEINISTTIKKRVIIGVLYRTIDAAGLMLGVHATKHLTISYSYDFDFGELRKYQTGSHELNLVYRFDGPKPKKVIVKSPRYLN